MASLNQTGSTSLSCKNKAFYSPETQHGHRVIKVDWNLEMLVFEERGKLEYLEINLSEQGREPTTNSTDMTPSLGIDPKPHWWEVGVLSTTPSLLPRLQGKVYCSEMTL